MTVPQQFRKKPVVIEAMQLAGTKESANRALAWIGQHDANARREHPTKPERGLLIETLEGHMHVSPGDWIIRGVQGEFYPCKPDIFQKTYDLALADEAPAVDELPNLVPTEQFRLSAEHRGEKVTVLVCGGASGYDAARALGGIATTKTIGELLYQLDPVRLAADMGVVFDDEDAEDDQ